MIKKIQTYLDDFIHLLYPHNCLGCGSDNIEATQLLCIRCLSQLPLTGFFSYEGNAVEKIFYGRIKVNNAGSAFYFTKDSMMQELLFELKYRGNRSAGTFLGKQIGLQIQDSNRFEEIDIIVPLPLNAKKQFMRGYNQAEIIADGIADVLQKPVANNSVIRHMFTETQTHKGRISRWQNMEDVFAVTAKEQLRWKHILLVDDVVTTGASLEACGKVLLEIEGAKLSIATAAYTI